MSDWRSFIRGFDRRDEPDVKEELPEEPSVFEVMDVLHDERVRRHDSCWFPGAAELERLARERRRVRA